VCFTTPIKGAALCGKSSRSLLLLALVSLCSCFSGYYSLLSPSLLFCLPMVHVKIAARPVGDDAQPEATETVPQELAEALSSLKPGSMGVASSPCRAGSPTDTSDSNGKSRSVNSS
jgi:hypothetical protein